MTRWTSILAIVFALSPGRLPAADRAEALPIPLTVAADSYSQPLVVDGDAWGQVAPPPDQSFTVDPWEGSAWGEAPPSTNPWRIVVLPDGLLYRSYLAGVHEPRMGGVWQHTSGVGDRWDITLGGRVGVLRYGPPGALVAEGVQLDVEGAAFPRLDLNDNNDLLSCDYRFGIPLTYAAGAYQAKFAYYHLSSHLGDELLVREPDLQRDNYSRDALVLGQGYFLTDDLRLYGELGYAFYTAGRSQPWETQFGAEFSPARPNGLRGMPFVAVNAHLLEDVDWGGNFVAQAGWQWRGDYNQHLFRLGFQYYNGKSNQFQFLTLTEVQYGFGIWYDY